MDAAEVVKVSFGKSIVIHGDDWQVRIFASASQPRHPEQTYWVLTETPYDEQTLEMLTEAQIDARLAAAPFTTFASPLTLEAVFATDDFFPSDYRDALEKIERLEAEIKAQAIDFNTEAARASRLAGLDHAAKIAWKHNTGEDASDAIRAEMVR